MGRKQCLLGEIVKFGNGKSRPKTEGIHPIYGGNGILGYTSETNYEGEIIVIGRVGAYCGATYYENRPIWVSDNALAAIPIENNNAKYLYYFLKNMDLNQHAQGSSHPLVTQTLLNSLDIEISDEEPEQKSIASVLSRLDDKIDLLHRQNKTLEAMAETLFRQWFVEEAQDDWEEKPLKEICVINNGYAFKSRTYQDYGQKIIRTLNFSNHWIELERLVFISQELAKSFEKYYLKRNDFLLVMVGASLGNFSIVTKDVPPALQNQNMWCFRAKKDLKQHYLNFVLRKLIDENLHGASGSARQFFQKSVFYELEVSIPPLAMMNEFEKVTEGYFQKIELNRSQIRTLEKLRDSLLSKLMSGEVRVEYAKEMVEDVI